MKICVISPGVVHAIPRTAAIASQFDEIHFIDTSGKTDTAKLASLGVICHSEKADGAPIKNGADLLRLLTNINPDIIVCHYASGDHFFNAISYGKCPVAAIAMGSDVFYDKGDSVVSLFTRLLIRMALRRSFYISAKSELLSKRIRSYGVSAPIDVNYWGCDLDKFSPKNKSEAKSKLGFAEGTTVILSPRAIAPNYNIHLIVEAFYTVLKLHDHIKFVILGRSTPHYKKMIEETVERLNLKDHALFLDEVSEENLLLYYQASDVVISMAQSEGFPNTALEVMACKVPLVIGSIPQIDELLENNRNAWICEKNPEAIANTVIAVLDDEKKRLRIAEAAYATTIQYADIKKNGITFSAKLKKVNADYSPKRLHWLSNIIFNLVFNIYRIQRKTLSLYP